MSEQGRRRGGRKIHRLSPREDVERELRLHLALREEELIAAGWEEAAARAEARRLFGDYVAIRRESSEIAERHARETRRSRMWSDVRQDLRYAVRWLVREPLFALIALVTLALGIGATTATFGIVNDVLLAPLPYPDPERLVAIREVNEQHVEIPVSWPNLEDWRQSARSFDSMSAYESPWDVTVLGGSEPVRAGISRVSGNFFQTLGVLPRRGRSFTAEELLAGGRPAVVVSDGFWRRELGGREDLASLRLDVAGTAAHVIGVMPAGFDYPRGADLWYPLDREDPAGLGARSAHNFRVVARLAPGVTVDAARAELSALAARIRQRHADSDAVAAAVHDLREDSVGSSRRPLLILLGASAFVLLVACTNLASALLARAARRQRELAIRAALGAHRLRLLRQLLTESLVLAVLGAAAGFGLAHLLLTLVTTVGPGAVPRLQEVRLDGWVLAFTTLLAVATALAFGTAPAMRATSTQPYDALQESGRGTETPRQRRVWSLLVAAEVALALLLLVGSGLLIRSFWNLLRVNPGFQSEGTLVVDLSLPIAKYASAADRVRFYDELLAHVRAVPGVQHASVTMTVPLVSPFDPNGLFDIEGGEVGDGDASYRVVSPGFFETTRTPVVRGRGFTPADRRGAPDVILINQTLAEQYFPDRDPIGTRMRTGGMDSRGFDFATIVGIVGDVRFRSLDRPPAPAYYLAYAQRPDRIVGMSLLVRGTRAPAQLAAPVRNVVRGIDSDVAIEIGTWSERIGQTLAEREFLLLVLGVFAAIALLLAAVGIYGVVSFAVVQRTREIGIRVALGALRGRVLWTVARSTMLSVFAGMALGLVGALLLARVTASLLFEVSAIDPLTFAAVAAILTATAWLAVLIPARRATRVSPMVALRAE